MPESYYVYRFINSDNQVIYVGKSKDNLKYRFTRHRHLPDECYNSVSRIEYIVCQTESDMSIKEIYYINKYCHENHITYNIADSTMPTEEIVFNDEWIFYDGYLPSWFSSSINVIRGFKEKKVKRYKKDGSVKNTTSNRTSGKNYDVYPLTDEEVHKVELCLVNHYQNSPNKMVEQISFRNLLIFMTGIQYPVKSNVLFKLKYKDIFDENDSVKPQLYQANRAFKDYQFVFHLDSSLKHLYELYRKKYCLSYKKNCEDYLFETRQHNPIKTGSFNYLLTNIVKEIGIKKNVGAETLRKTYGIHIYNMCSDKNRAFDYLEIIFGYKGYGDIAKYLCLISKEYDYDRFLSTQYAYEGNNIVYSSMLKIPESYYRNEILMDKDKSNPNVSVLEIQKNIENGKYYLSDGQYARIKKTPYYNK